ncbi:MAG: hypothetical protein ACHQZS_07260 [Candidatus Binatales bacterium]
MANVIANAPTLGIRIGIADRAETRSGAAIPWYAWCLAAAATSALIGGYWDISWHISIGRDTFWTPAHMAIYLAGVLAGVACGYAILSTTFGSATQAKVASVSIWGFRGPLGCFIAAWGGVLMLTSAPFDNWWHAAYGLDVKILSPPHVMLAMGIGAIKLGALMLVCAQANRATGANRIKFDRLLLYIASVELTGDAGFMLEKTWPTLTHSSEFYFAVCTGFPLILVLIATISQARWPATTVAAVYTALFALAVWIFPLFPAEPKLGPVYQHVTHFIPLGFPLPIIVPAFAVDLLRHRMGARWGAWKSALLAGSVFFVTLLAVEWPWGYFMNSPLARNRIFGRIYFPYSDPANVLYNPYHFHFPEKTTAAFITGMVMALVGAMVVSSIAMALGNWMRQLKR